jgi:hypothetical protein
VVVGLVPSIFSAVSAVSNGAFEHGKQYWTAAALDSNMTVYQLIQLVL